MKEIKFLLTVLIGGIYSSAWWVGAIFGDKFWFIPGSLSFLAIIASAIYIADNWNKS